MSLYPNHPVVNIDGLEIVITPHEQARRLLLPADQQLVVDEFWKEHKAKAAAAGRSVKNNDIYGGEVVRLSDNKLEVRRDTIFTFAEVAARKTGHLVPPRSRWTAPSLIKFNITNVNAGGLDELSKNSDLIDTTFADRSGRYYGFGVHEPSNQLYVATGPMMTREFALQPNPLLEAFRARQLEFGLDIDESKHRFRFWFQDGEMNLIMPEAEYTETGQGVRERFERRGTSPISKLVIVSRDLDAVQAANAHYAKLNIRPWEWIGPVVATDLGLTA